jgi:hypothetical protein
MKPMQNTISPRTPLTITELETLAVMLDSAGKKMSIVRTNTGEYAWPMGREMTDAFGDMFGGFYQLRDNTSALIAAHDQMPWDTAEGQVLISSAHA